MLNFEFIQAGGSLVTAEVGEQNGRWYAAPADNPTRRVEGATRDEAVAALKALLIAALPPIEPMAPRTAAGAPPAAPAKPGRRPRRPVVHLGRPAQILVVEDNPVSLEVAIASCQMAGHHATGAYEGQIAAQWLQSTAFDLILTDLHMPGVGGLALVRWLRATPPWLDVPIIGVTAAGPNGQAQLWDAGIDGLVKKPYGPPELIEAIGELVRF